MTRFARAKGSKSSNERVPEEATPWREIKQQLLEKNNEVVENKKKQAAFNQRNANYKAFLEEKEDEARKKTQWAEFPSENNNKKIIVNNQDETDEDETFLDLKAKVDKVLTKLDDKKSAENDSDAAPDEHSSKIQPSEPEKKIKKTKKKKLSIVVKTENKYEETKQKEKIPEEKPKSKKRKLKEDINQPKLKKIKNDVIKKNLKDLSEKDLKLIEKKKQKRIKQLEKKKKVKEELKKQKELEPKTETENKPNLEKTTKNKQRDDNKEHKRRKPFLPTKMFINGKEIDIDYVDGFPVKKEDAIRLKQLRKEMISKGLPRSEINISLKLERRKAEKAFTREKKKVCFNCRKSGHNLFECPELDKGQLTSQSGVGICFKCGSTEHTHFECKVVRGPEYKYAQCFICNEQGHISRQCPDNARGLYPKGGACRVCGDVTHLKKDCPKYQSQQLQIQNSLSIETIGESNPDVLDDKNQFNNNNLQNGRSNKIIKF